jgi:hypothetical protein
MGREEIFHTFLLLVEIEGHFTHELVTYVYETVSRSLFFIEDVVARGVSLFICIVTHL